MIHITHITILNGNSNPLYEADCNKKISNNAHLRIYRKRVKDVALRRYKKEPEELSVMFQMIEQ